MKYFIDTEFAETGGKPVPTIDLISIAIVSEDGRPYYAVSSEFDYGNCNAWVQKNVFPHLTEHRTPRFTIKQEVLDFVGSDPSPEFWGYYCDYDWVVFCWLFGNMVELPQNWPMMCMDLQQWWIHLGRPDIKPPQPVNIHDALADADWNRAFYWKLHEYSQNT